MGICFFLYKNLTCIRCTLHTASWDYENAAERHGTRVTTLAEEPYFDEKASTRRQALGLEDD